MSYEPKDKRVIIYPDYINSKKTVAQGRRIPQDKACEWPAIQEMLDACIKGLKLEAEFERKRYPRNWMVEPDHADCYGRIRVTLKKDDGTPVNPAVPTRRELMVQMAHFVALHPDRHKKASKADAASSSSAGGNKQSGKKSGKKKK